MARLRLHLVLRRTFQLLPGGFGQVLHDFIQVRHGVDAEDKPHVPGVVPTVQVLRLREIRVASQEDFLETGPPAQTDRTVEVDGGMLVARPVAGAVDDIQRLGRVGQGDEQGMVAPLALVADVHALFALACGFDHRAVALNDRLPEERLGLLPPDFQPCRVEDFHQADDVAEAEAAAEVAGRSRIGDAAGTQGVHVRLVAAQQFQVFQTRAARQKIVGDVQHVVRLVVGEVHPKQLQAAVDGLIQAEFLRQEVYGRDAAGPGCLGAIGDFIVDV